MNSPNESLSDHAANHDRQGDFRTGTTAADGMEPGAERVSLLRG